MALKKQEAAEAQEALTAREVDRADHGLDVQTTTTDRPQGSCCAPSNTNECANCAAPEEHAEVTLRHCSRCKLVQYCSTECQAQHWKSGGHRKNCVAVSERSLKAAVVVSSSEKGASSSSAECASCLESLETSSIRSLCCGHVMHAACVQEFISSGGARVCPLCRADIT